MEMDEEKKRAVAIYRTQRDGYILAVSIGYGPMLQIWEPRCGCFVEGWYEQSLVLCEKLEEIPIDDIRHRTKTLRNLLTDAIYCYAVYAESERLAEQYYAGKNGSESLCAEKIMQELRRQWETARKNLCEAVQRAAE